MANFTLLIVIIVLIIILLLLLVNNNSNADFKLESAFIEDFNANKQVIKVITTDDEQRRLMQTNEGYNFMTQGVAFLIEIEYISNVKSNNIITVTYDISLLDSTFDPTLNSSFIINGLAYPGVGNIASKNGRLFITYSTPQNIVLNVGDKITSRSGILEKLNNLANLKMTKK